MEKRGVKGWLVRWRRVFLFFSSFSSLSMNKAKDCSNSRMARQKMAGKGRGQGWSWLDEPTSYGAHRYGFISMSPGSSITFRVTSLPLRFWRTPSSPFCCP